MDASCPFQQLGIKTLSQPSHTHAITCYAMDSIFDATVSYYANAKSTSGDTVTLRAFLRNKTHRAAVEALRKEQDPERRSALKRDLRAATVSGTFSKRKASECTQYNGCICIDFDGKDNADTPPAAIKAMLAEYAEIAYAGLSASGTGVFAIVPTNLTDVAHHAKAVEILGSVFEKIGLKYDRSCKDVCRLRFISVDDEAYWNEAANSFDARHWLSAAECEPKRRQNIPATVKHTEADRDRNKIHRYVEAIESRGCDITANYADWVRIGMAISSAMGVEGENYYHRISQFNPDYNREKTAKKYAELMRNAKSVGIGSFFKIANDNGIRP